MLRLLLLAQTVQNLSLKPESAAWPAFWPLVLGREVSSSVPSRPMIVLSGSDSGRAGGVGGGGGAG